MPPKRTTTTTTPMSDVAIKALIAQSVADALEEHEANRSRNGDDNHDSGTGSRRTERAAHEYMYNDFLKCRPLNFKGTEGVWKSHVKTIGHTTTYGMPWKTLMKMMADKYCPRGEVKKLEIEIWNLKVKGIDVGSVMASKPKTMQEAIDIANDLMSQRTYTAGPGEKKVYLGSKPLCLKCNYYHDGKCAPRCNNCKKACHLARDCRSPAANANANANNQRNFRAN
ncbi:hypothetical protein Tco_1216358 [Tanacetum coccineum]